jgi:hypothetical protein
VQLGQILPTATKDDSVYPESPEERVKGRIRVEPEGLGGAFDGDRVIATIRLPSGLPGGRALGAVELVVARSRLLITGRLAAVSGSPGSSRSTRSSPSTSIWSRKRSLLVLTAG